MYEESSRAYSSEVFYRGVNKRGTAYSSEMSYRSVKKAVGPTEV